MAARCARLRRWSLGVLVAGGVVWAAGLALFLAAIPTTTMAPQRRTDAIVVLTGGSLRLETGFRLLKEGKSDHLLISGVFPGAVVTDLLGEDGARLCCVTLGYEALDTAGNALEAARWMRAHGFHSLRLVTASYHTPRSLLEFRKEMPDAEIIPNPVFPEPVRVGAWFLRSNTVALAIGEYHKWLLTWARHGVAALAARGAALIAGGRVGGR